MRNQWLVFTFTASLAALPSACGELGDDCADSKTCDTGGGGQGAATTTSGGGGAGANGGGGGGPCGTCSAPEPLCDVESGICVACLADGDCTDPAAAKCDGGSCVACDDSTQCAGITGTEVCAAGTCVECALGEEDACTGGETCDLVAGECVAIGPGSVQNCGACTNDQQCADGRCIPMEFPLGTPYGHYCLEEAMPTCQKPFLVPINRPSINGAGAVNYCGINEDLATCEAVLALENDWRCPGEDGKCCMGSSDPLGGMCASGEPEVAVPGALCRQVGLGADRCTFACGGASECLNTPTPGSTCGTGTPPDSPPEWCGG